MEKSHSNARNQRYCWAKIRGSQMNTEKVMLSYRFIANLCAMQRGCRNRRFHKHSCFLCHVKMGTLASSYKR